MWCVPSEWLRHQSYSLACIREIAQIVQSHSMLVMIDHGVSGQNRFTVEQQQLHERYLSEGFDCTPLTQIMLNGLKVLAGI